MHEEKTTDSVQENSIETYTKSTQFYSSFWVHTSVTYKAKTNSDFRHDKHREPEEEKKQQIQGRFSGKEGLEARRGEGEHQVS